MAQEKNFENRIKTFLKSKDIWHIKFFANGFTKRGVPDILSCINGHFVAIEVKADKGVASELQKYNVEKINNTHGIAVIVDPSQMKDLKAMVEYILDDDIDDALKMKEQINYKYFKE